MEAALTHHQAGRLVDAEAGYRNVLSQAPDHADALHMLGVLAAQTGHGDAAIQLIGRAIAIVPQWAEAHNNLGSILYDRGRPQEAVAPCRRAIELKPDYPEAFYNLANALAATGGNAEAISAYQRSIALRPDYADAYNNLGSLYLKAGDFDGAMAAYQRAIQLRPDLGQLYNNLGSAYWEQHHLDRAVAAYRQAIRLDARCGQAYNNLGNALVDQGRLAEAMDCYRTAGDLLPGDPVPESNRVYTAYFQPGLSSRQLLELNRQWASRYADSLLPVAAAHDNSPDPRRRLRIGYVSPDFRNHVVGRNVLPLLQRHDRAIFEITAYANVSRPDEITRQFQQQANRWRNILGCSDEQVAKQIREDGIDILVDLTLHMLDNRLGVFARKPAPLQVTFAGYPGTTGLAAIDYRLSDPYLDPPGIDESVYSERTLRLPHSFWCYDPRECADIPVNSLPALQSKQVTFGCLNNFCKINDALLDLWARVLGEIPNSCLVLLSHEGSHRQAVLDRLAKQGIDSGRVEFLKPRPRRQYLQLYHRIDVGLDSYPYNGHTTSLDSLWMGVPVVTLVGQTPVSRAGWSQLSNLGLSSLAATAPAEFVAIAVKLATDLQTTAELRASLRRRMEQSPLMDAAAFARDVETAYREMWERWCGARKS